MQFSNRFVNQLPADLEQSNFRRQVFDATHSLVHPDPVSKPKLLSFVAENALTLGFSLHKCNHLSSLMRWQEMP